MDTKVRIATRKSPLALWQANYIKSQMLKHHPEIHVEICEFTTKGDKILNSSLSLIGGKGLFVKELEHALLANTADIAVHSMKDVPIELPVGLHIPTICKSEDPRDAFVSDKYKTFDSLPPGSRLGTSSLRRQCQLLQIRKDIHIVDIRGNLDTRLAKISNGDIDAAILAVAGLSRLGRSDRISFIWDTDQLLPAVGQGAVGIECREDDLKINELLTPLNHIVTNIRLVAERALNKKLSGGCQVPIGGHALVNGDQLILHGLVGKPDGSRIIKSHIRGNTEFASDLGTQLAEDLLSQGAGKILNSVSS